MSAETERLIHILLCEEIGSDKIPDVTDRVLMRVFEHRRRSWPQMVSAPLGQFFRRHSLLGGGRFWPRGAAVAAVAALLLVCVVAVWRTTGHRYPAPEASGSYRLLDATEVCRGAVLVTDDQPASLALGGYCQVRLEPNTELRIQGKSGEEAVLLQKGAVKCDVNPGIGAFTVRSRVGTVSVLGTSFSVKLLESKGATAAGTSRQAVSMLAVAVTSGSVSVEHEGVVSKVSAGSQQVFGTKPSPAPNQPGRPRAPEKVTVTGMGKALRDPNGKLDPAAANATVTVTANGAKVVYDVYGWGGVIIAKQANGKKVDVTGFLGEKDGKKTITAASVGVKIIIVEEDPSRQPPP